MTKPEYKDAIEEFSDEKSYTIRPIRFKSSMIGLGVMLWMQFHFARTQSK